jgi:hypothetical protein
VRPFSERKRGEEARRLHDAGVNAIEKSGAAIVEVEGGGWPLEVEDDKRKLGQWAECEVGPNC